MATKPTISKLEPRSPDVPPPVTVVGSVRLRGGWKGRCVTEIDGNGFAAIGPWTAFLETLIDAPQRLAGYAVLKSSKTGVVCRALLETEAGPTAVVCKRSEPRGFARRIGARFRSSRGRRNWERGARLLAAGIATARPLALIERGGWRSADWLITEACEGVVDLDQIALALLPRLDRSAAAAIKTRLAMRIADLLTAFDRSTLHHRDLKASNILFSDWDGESPTVVIVDLDGLGRSRNEAADARRRLVRLGASLTGYRTITRTDAARVLRAYHARRGDPESTWRSTWRQASPLLADYNRAAAGRKHGKIDGYGGRNG